ncbi:MAG: wax ester/triacylglycerol synthase family O-acyltransferase [Actinobacteria bacterium]|nr:wax ester/triacylglycerol synthase family O-acyltransferase [Actinomycetota bacterium]
MAVSQRPAPHPERLNALDVSFLYLEGRSTPMHVGSLAVFDSPAQDFDYERLVRLVERRIELVPRYRQKVRWVPGHLANPVWIDDPDFDLTYHVRRSGLPRPGTEAQLREFCARILSRPLDRGRPLWEMYLIDGLGDGQVAIATKTHYALVDGIKAIDIAQVILDDAPDSFEPPPPVWLPRPAPSNVELTVGALRDLVTRPTALLDALRLGARDARATAGTVASLAGGVLSAARSTLRPPPASPLNVRVGEHRRLAVARTTLADHRLVHQAQRVSVNDVVLCALAGAFRSWLLFRGEPVHPTTTIRAMLPVVVRDPDVPDTDRPDQPPDRAGRVGSAPDVSAILVDLPVGESNPLVRLAQVGFATRPHAASGRSVRAEVLVTLGGFAPPTLHAVGARVASGLARRLYNVVVTNVPGPQRPMYAAGARLREIYPIVPLTESHAVAVGVSSYDGSVFYALNADGDAVPDADVLVSMIEEALAELVEAVLSGSARVRTPRSGGSGRSGRSPRSTGSARSAARRASN